MTSPYDCPSCTERPYTCDTQIYLTETLASGGYETDSSWELNHDESDDELSESMETNVKDSESDDDTPVVVRKPKIAATSKSPAGGAATITFSDVSRKFTNVLKAAHMPM